MMACRCAAPHPAAPSGAPQGLGGIHRGSALCSWRFLLRPSLVPKLPRGAHEVTRRVLAGGWGRGEAKLLAPLKRKAAREGTGVLRVQTLSESYENVAASHVPPKEEVSSHKSTQSRSQNDILQEKHVAPLRCCLQRRHGECGEPKVRKEKKFQGPGGSDRPTDWFIASTKTRPFLTGIWS